MLWSVMESLVVVPEFAVLYGLIALFVLLFAYLVIPFNAALLLAASSPFWVNLSVFLFHHIMMDSRIKKKLAERLE